MCIVVFFSYNVKGNTYYNLKLLSDKGWIARRLNDIVDNSDAALGCIIFISYLTLASLCPSLFSKRIFTLSLEREGIVFWLRLLSIIFDPIKVILSPLLKGLLLNVESYKENVIGNVIKAELLVEIYDGRSKVIIVRLPVVLVWEETVPLS